MKSPFHNNSRHMLPVVDWLADIPADGEPSDLVEVQFKNTRKGYYHNTRQLPLEKGTQVVTEADPGTDLGEVTLTGRLVALQLRKHHPDSDRYTVRSLLRLATEEDLERAATAHSKEQQTMIQARQLAASLGLEMKIGDVEYQGDGSKAIFYYIADGRVDFRQLIKLYAETFRVRIEMRQIGARQEAGRIGGTGPCGRELCCSTWMTQFSSVGTLAARVQNISPNPQKLAGLCAKLKCCLNYELPQYEEAIRAMPSRRQPLETAEATYYFFAADPMRGEITYSTDPHHPVNLQTLTVQQAQAIVERNQAGEKPASLGGKQSSEAALLEPDFGTGVGQDALNRFDRKRGGKGGNKGKNRPQNNGKANGQANGQNNARRPRPDAPRRPNDRNPS